MDSAYPIFLSIHSVVRWIVLILGFLAAVKAIIGWMGKQGWGAADRQLGLLFTISLDVQVLVGLILYLVLSPRTTQAFGNFGEAMSDATTRFFLVEHSLMMVVALVLAHIGRSQSKKASPDVNKHKRAAIFFTLSLIAIILAIPW